MTPLTPFIPLPLLPPIPPSKRAFDQRGGGGELSALVFRGFWGLSCDISQQEKVLRGRGG